MEEYVLVPSEFCGNKTQPHHYESFFTFWKDFVLRFEGLDVNDRH